MATLLEEYIAKLNAQNNAYTPLTQAEMEAQAARKYQSIYDLNRLSAQQEYETGELARQQQQDELNAMYDLQQEQSRQNYEDAIASAYRNALSRGMQRSSYIGATAGNLAIKGAEAQQAINRNREGSIKNIAEQGALAKQQLASQITQYNKNQMADELAYLDELEAREYDRALQASDRANQIATDIYNAQITAGQNNWFGMAQLLTQGNPVAVATGGGDGGGSSSSTKKSSSSSNKNNSSSSSTLDSLVSSLGGSISGGHYIPAYNAPSAVQTLINVGKQNIAKNSKK